MNRQFYSRLYSGCSGDDAVLLMTLPGRGLFRFPANAAGDIFENAVDLGSRFDTYISINPRRPDLPEGARGTEKDVTSLVAIMADIDVFDEAAHREKALPPDKETAVDFINSLPFRPSAIIDSGYGIYAVYIMKTPVPITDDETRSRIKGITTGIGRVIRERGAERGWKLDTTVSLDHMFHAPGGLNHKKAGSPVLTTVLDISGPSCSLEDFEEYYEVPEDYSVAPYDVDPREIGSAERILAGCAFCRKLRDDPAAVTGDEWYAMCANLALAQDGPEKFHEWSALDGARYSEAETDRKIRRALEQRKPTRCSTIRDRYPGLCPEDGCVRDNGNVVRAPVVLARYSREEQVDAFLQKQGIAAKDLFDPYILKLAAWADDESPIQSVELEDAARKARCVSRFRKAVQAQKAKDSDTEITAADFGRDDVTIHMEGLDLRGAVVPDGYRISRTEGISKDIFVKDAAVPTQICSVPAFITTRLEDIDNQQQYMELTFLCNEQWRSVRASQVQVSDKNKLLSLAAQGLMVNSNNAGSLVGYFADYEAKNRKRIPLRRSIKRLGWVGKEFFPYTTKDVIFGTDDPSGIVEGIKESGDPRVWLKAASEVRKSLAGRAIMAAAFASPLLYPMEHRNVYLHVWCTSGSGKTAALKLAIAAFGDPRALMGSYSMTPAGSEIKASLLHHLPLALDELQVFDGRHSSLSDFVYNLANGEGKTRSNERLTVSEKRTWQNCIISTGEQPISSETAMDGMNNRVLEIKAVPIENRDYAGKVHQIAEKNYGFGGKKLVEFAATRDCLKDYNAMWEELVLAYDGEGEGGSQLENTAMLMAGDFYASMCLFGESEEQASEEAIQMGLGIMENYNGEIPGDSIENEWAVVVGWVTANIDRFIAQDALSDAYGVVERDDKVICATVAKMNEVLRNAGLNVRHAVSGFAERGYIDTFTRSGKRRY